MLRALLVIGTALSFAACAAHPAADRNVDDSSPRSSRLLEDGMNNITRTGRLIEKPFVDKRGRVVEERRDIYLKTERRELHRAGEIPPIANGDPEPVTLTPAATPASAG